MPLHPVPSSARSRLTPIVVTLASLAALAGGSRPARAEEATAAPPPALVAAEVDRLLEELRTSRGVEAAPPVSEAGWFRRAMRTLAGRMPSPEEVTLFVLDPATDKRASLVDGLVESEEWARHQARTWRDIILSRAQDPRARVAAPVIEDWFAAKFAGGSRWDEISRDLITAKGAVSEHGETALILAQMGQAEEVAAEVSRVLLGIQIQCAQCHDHPYASWTRRQFHELAAYFPRLRLQRAGQGPRAFEVVSIAVPSPREQDARRRFAGNRFATEPLALLERFDADQDGALVEAELPERLRRPFQRILQFGDKDSDGKVTREEIERFAKKERRLPARGEHLMADLARPDEPGTLVHPAFFLDGSTPGEFVGDEDRRAALAKAITDPSKPWLARAYVNRTWAEFLGRGFVEPVDDLGGDATAAAAFDLLSREFVRSGYDVRWLFRTIAATDAFARESRPRDSTECEVFAAVAPRPLRADPVLEALREVLGGTGDGDRARGSAGPLGFARRFEELFGFDPSMPIDEVAPSIPQALFLMNSPAIEGWIDARRGMLAPILAEHESDRAVVEDLWLRVLARAPREDEVAVALEHVKAAPARGEAFEDVVWSLLNSYEFRNRQ